MSALDTLVAVAIAVQAWTLKEVIALKLKVSALIQHNHDNKHEEKRKNMRKYLVLFCLLIATVLAPVLSGCGTMSPGLQAVYTVPTPGVTNVAYTVSPGLSNVLASVATLNHDFTPAPFGGIVDGALALIVAGLGIYARVKTVQASNHAAAADLLAATTVKAGTQVQALQAASGTPAYTTVAQHLDNNTL